jgi:hypothetical protein
MPVTNPPVALFTPAELWYYNGTALNQPYWNITTFGGSRYGLPTLRGQNYEVPYRAGQVWRAKYPDQRTITLTMWTDSQMSANQSYPAGDPRRAFNDNWQQLRQLFWYRGASGSAQGQLQRNWFITQSGSPTLVTTTAMAEIAGSMDPTMNGRTSAAFSVDLLLADPHFYGAQRTQALTSAGGTITALGEGVVGEGYYSAVNSFTLKLSAAATVANTTAGTSVTHNGTGVASWPVTLDILRYTATDNVGNNCIAGVSHSGSRLWTALLPGANTITVSAGTATFTWNDCYV